MGNKSYPGKKVSEVTASSIFDYFWWGQSSLQIEWVVGEERRNSVGWEVFKFKSKPTTEPPNNHCWTHTWLDISSKTRCDYTSAPYTNQGSWRFCYWKSQSICVRYFLTELCLPWKQTLMALRAGSAKTKHWEHVSEIMLDLQRLYKARRTTIMNNHEYVIMISILNVRFTNSKDWPVFFGDGLYIGYIMLYKSIQSSSLNGASTLRWGHEKESWIHERRVPPRARSWGHGASDSERNCVNCVPHGLRSEKWRQIMIYIYIYICNHIYV